MPVELRQRFYAMLAGVFLNFVTFYVFNIFMAALCSKCGHYIFALWFLSFFLLSSSFFLA